MDGSTVNARQVSHKQWRHQKRGVIRAKISLKSLRGFYKASAFLISKIPENPPRLSIHC